MIFLFDSYISGTSWNNDDFSVARRAILFVVRSFFLVAPRSISLADTAVIFLGLWVNDPVAANFLKISGIDTRQSVIKIMAQAEVIHLEGTWHNLLRLTSELVKLYGLLDLWYLLDIKLAHICVSLSVSTPQSERMFHLFYWHSFITIDFCWTEPQWNDWGSLDCCFNLLYCFA